MDRNGQIRFTYRELRNSLDAITSGNDPQVPHSVLELFSKICGAVFNGAEPSDTQQKTLLLALLNCHMAYHLLSGHLLNKDESIIEDKELF